MEHLDFGGKRYIKVSSAARETGYTSDYIGQLCRAKKIDAKLVGRTWYVAHDEITSHKRTRGRSTYEKTRKAVKSAVTAATEAGGEVYIPIRRGDAPTYRERLVSAPVRYHADETALIPTVRNTREDQAVHIAVRTATPQAVPVVLGDTAPEHLAVDTDTTENESVRFNRTAPSEIKWNGTIVVSSLEDSAPPQISPRARNVSPLERHLRIHAESERNSKVNIDTSDTAHDPLEVKSRFLERMNLAHDLNTSHARSPKRAPRIVQKVNGGEALHSKQRAIATLPHQAPKESIKGASMWKSASVYAVTVFGISAALLAGSVALSSEHTYRSSGVSEAGITRYTSSIHVDSLSTILSTMLQTISSIRDNYSISRIISS